MESKQSLDFLNLEPANATPQSEIEFAQLYVSVFVHNPEGARLLAHWEKALFWKPTPVNATHQQYAYDEARRQWVRDIRGQIELVAQRREASVS